MGGHHLVGFLWSNLAIGVLGTALHCLTNQNIIGPTGSTSILWDTTRWRDSQQSKSHGFVLKRFKCP